MKTSIIELKGLTKTYGLTHVVDNLDLNIEKGEIFGLLGPNGAGKTTTILMMLGLVEPTSGTPLISGHNATTNPISIKSKVGYMPDNIGFYDQMTGLENLMYIGQLNGLSRFEVEKMAIEVMDTVGLSHAINMKTATFSRGMKQRLGLAEVLIKQPEIIILDEPTLGIDPTGVKAFLELIKQLSHKKGLTVLLSSHHLNQVQQVCDRVGIFVKGKLLAEGNISELSKKLFPEASYQIYLTLKEPIQIPWKDQLDLMQLHHIEKVTIKENQIHIACNKDLTPDIVRFMATKNYDIIGVHQKEYGLVEIYQKYFENPT
ncbi:ABC transporter ATP-binding protein [Flagellimonas olearia]|uniref:ABC transporter ATP-binding protein n=1 Tax=Flagellimonas olearia TaxID=552546 RepID=A0A444VRM5_9FLAO|nr:ABC transporter ATP-binding protein [Allomuricauda olearia]RYC53458.1 ABC transporter ATP-binding protein [Allomuricauda olearia]